MSTTFYWPMIYKTGRNEQMSIHFFSKVHINNLARKEPKATTAIWSNKFPSKIKWLSFILWQEKQKAYGHWVRYISRLKLISSHHLTIFAIVALTSLWSRFSNRKERFYIARYQVYLITFILDSTLSKCQLYCRLFWAKYLAEETLHF